MQLEITMMTIEPDFQVSEIEIVYKRISRENRRITSPQEAYDVLMENWNENLIDLQEQFKAVYLNNANEVLAMYCISSGTTNAALADPKLLFVTALKINASNILIAHNHPSGNLKPSQADIKLTEKLKAGAEILGFNLVDHLIVSRHGYYSFGEDCIL